MKRIFLLTFIISLPMFSALSQINKSLRIDTTSQNLFIFKYSKPNLGTGNNDFVKIFKENNDPNLLFLTRKNKPEKFPMIVIYDLESEDHMLCIKPKGYFSMRIYKPDTRYVLLNK